MRSLASDSHVAAMFRGICRCSGDLDWFAKPGHSLACCRYCETLRIPPPASSRRNAVNGGGRSEFAAAVSTIRSFHRGHTTASVGGQARAVESAAVDGRGKRERRSPHLSRHLSELEDLRIIEVEWQGTRKYHSLNSAPLARPLDGRQSVRNGPSGSGLVSRVSPVQTAVRNCTRDEGRSFEVGNQVLISSHRKLLSSKAMVVNVAEKSGQDSDRQG